MAPACHPFSSEKILKASAGGGGRLAGDREDVTRVTPGGGSSQVRAGVSLNS